MPTQSQIQLHKIFRNSWKWVFSFIVLVPVVRWFMIAPIAPRFVDGVSIATSLGQLAGIVGTLLFSFSMIASYRNRLVEKLFGGLDTLYRVHHLFGMYGLFLLLLHPVLLSFGYVTSSLEDAMYFFTPFQTSTAVDFGVFSLLLFMVLIGVTLFGSLFAYQHLKVGHKFLGVAFLLGTIHGFMIPGDIQDDPMIRYIVLGFACTGILMYILYSLLKTWTMRQYLYTVSAVNALTPDSTEIVMVPQGKGIFPLPGQFAFFSFINSDILPKESHPFTISSWTGTGSLILSAKSLGDYTSQLSHEHIGEEVNVEGPYGEFSYLYGSSKQVWVAGGIGVTPFVAMVEHMLTQETLPYQIDFFYSTRTKQDALYQDIFQSAAQKFPSFMYHPMPSDTEGYITGEFLVEKVQGILLKDIFICGPPPMMKALIASLTGLGINKRRIHSELFALLK